MQAEDLYAGVATELRKLIALSVLHNEQVAARVGMSLSEMQALHLIQLHGPLSPGQLAELTGLTTGSITAVIDRLEELGLAKRERQTDDRRRVVVSTQPDRIAEVLDVHFAQYAELVQKAMAASSSEELTAVLAFLKRLSEGN